MGIVSNIHQVNDPWVKVCRNLYDSDLAILKAYFFINKLSLVFITFAALVNYLYQSNTAWAQDKVSRGIWYDYGGKPMADLSGEPIVREILAYKGLQRVHIMVDDPFWDSDISNDCQTKYPCQGDKFKDCVPTMQCAEKGYTFGFNRWAYRPTPTAKKFIDQSFFLARFVDLLDKNHVEVILTIFPEPNDRYINTLVTNLATFVVGSKRSPPHRVYGIELEDEENWDSNYTEVSGGTDQNSALNSAAEELINKLRSDLPGIKIGVSLAPPKSIWSSYINDNLANNNGIDFISLQAYHDTHKPRVVVNSGGQVISKKLICHPELISSPFSPQQLLTNTLTLVDKITQNSETKPKDIILGLSAYELDCPEVQGEQGATGRYHIYSVATQATCDSSNRNNIIGTDYFSFRWVHEQRRVNNYANSFLTSCATEKIRDNYCHGNTKTEFTPDTINAEFNNICNLDRRGSVSK